MTHINFYVSKDEGLQNRLAIACRLTNVALKNNLSVHIHTDNESTSKLIDDKLWTTDKTSFIPHTIVTAEQHQSDTPKNHTKRIENVTISHNFEPMNDCDYLINISNQRPDFFSRFTKVAEIIDASKEILVAGRERYAFYRDRGYTLKYHQL
jgi:DNA polymerase-3 subunit chi